METPLAGLSNWSCRLSWNESRAGGSHFEFSVGSYSENFSSRLGTSVSYITHHTSHTRLEKYYPSHIISLHVHTAERCDITEHFCSDCSISLTSFWLSIVWKRKHPNRWGYQITSILPDNIPDSCTSTTGLPFIISIKKYYVRLSTTCFRISISASISVCIYYVVTSQLWNCEQKDNRRLKLAIQSRRTICSLIVVELQTQASHISNLSLSQSVRARVHACMSVLSP